MATDRAALPQAPCAKAPAATPTPDECVQQAETLQRMAKALAGRLRKAGGRDEHGRKRGLDWRVANTSDPQESSHRVPAAGFIPLSVPRQRRIDVSGQMEKAKAALGNALAVMGEPWQD